MDFHIHKPWILYTQIKDGFSIIKHLENSASYKIIYILSCTKQMQENISTLLLWSSFVH